MSFWVDELFDGAWVVDSGAVVFEVDGGFGWGWCDGWWFTVSSVGVVVVCVEHFSLALFGDVCPGVVVDVVGGVAAECFVVVLGVVEGDEGVGIGVCLLDGCEGVWPGGVVFEGFEPGFDVGVVVADVGAAIAGGDVVFGVERLEGFGGHHRTVVGVDDLDFAGGGRKDLFEHFCC